MKIDLLDWFIAKLNLTTDEEIETPKSYEFHERNNSNQRVFIKRVQSYENCQTIIDEVKEGVMCLVIISPMDNMQSQMMLLYLQGAMYVLELELKEVGKNVYLLSQPQNSKKA